jgi:hypothetical protein
MIRWQLVVQVKFAANMKTLADGNSFPQLVDELMRRGVSEIAAVGSPLTLPRLRRFDQDNLIPARLAKIRDHQMVIQNSIVYD